MRDLKSFLENLYEDYDFKDKIEHDPISFPHRYQDERDIEVAGLIASSLAYRKISHFMPIIEKILSPMGKSPSEFLLNFEPGKHRHLFKGIKYKFQDSDDILAMLFVMNRVLRQKISFYELFKSSYREGDSNIKEALTGMVDYVLKVDMSEVYGKAIRTKGFMHLFPSPRKGSACKRLNLFLRWMVRRKDIDFGIWKEIPPSKLVIPLDTHIKRVSLCLGLTSRKTPDWKMAVEITESLKRLDPKDPLKYDFALCHRGISGVCRERNCGDCVMRAAA